MGYKRSEHLKSLSIPITDQRLIGAIPRTALVISLACLILLTAFMNMSELDLMIARQFANGESGFLLRGHWITNRLLHYYVGKLIILLGLGLVLYNLKQLVFPNTNRELVVIGRYVLLSWLVSFAIVGVLKQVTTLPCPWNLIEFGGSSDYLPVLKAFSNLYPSGNCFPSGHATGVYALLCLGFAAIVVQQPMRYVILPVLLLGGLLGGAQMVRGAHFVSHDLTSIAISLTVAWLTAEMYLWPSIARIRDQKIISTERLKVPPVLTP